MINWEGHGHGIFYDTIPALPADTEENKETLAQGSLYLGRETGTS
jgi:hypothetical protein